jgi:hypothetical protein
MSEALRQLTPFTEATREVSYLLPPDILPQSPLDDASDIVAAKDQLRWLHEEQKTSPAVRILRNALLGGLAGAVAGYAKGYLTGHGSTDAAKWTSIGLAGLGAAGAGGITYARHKLAPSVADRSLKTIERSDPVIRDFSERPAIHRALQEYNKSTWMPGRGAEIGALLGGLGSFGYDWIKGRDNNLGNAALAAGVAGGLGGIIGMLYKSKQKNKMLKEIMSSLNHTKVAVLTEADQNAITEARRKRRKEKQFTNSYTPLVAGLGLAGLGYGAYRLGANTISPEDRVKLDDFASIGHRLGTQVYDNKKVDAPRADLAASKALLYDYVDKGSAASSTKPFGINIPDLMLKARSTDIAKKLLPPDFYLGDKSPEHIKGSLDHYTQFSRGPIPAYLKLMDEVRERAEKGEDKFFELNKHYGKPADYINSLRTSTDAFLKEKYGPNISLDNVEKNLNHGQQLDALRSIDGWLSSKDPELASKKNQLDTTVSSGQGWASKMYSKATGVGTTLVQDVPKAIGLIGMAAGAGLATYWLYKKLKKNRDNNA